MKTIADTKESFREDFKSAISGNAAMITVTVAALLAELNSEIDKLPSYVDKMEGSTSQALERLKTTCTEEAASAATAATNAAANFGAELAKEEINVVIDSIMNKMSVLKSQVIHMKDTEIDNVKPVKESAEEEIFGSFDGFDFFGESAETFFAGSVDNIEDEEFSESADEKTIDQYLDEMFGESAEDPAVGGLTDGEDPLGFDF